MLEKCTQLYKINNLLRIIFCGKMFRKIQTVYHLFSCEYQLKMAELQEHIVEQAFWMIKIPLYTSLSGAL